MGYINKIIAWILIKLGRKVLWCKLEKPKSGRDGFIQVSVFEGEDLIYTREHTQSEHIIAIFKLRGQEIELNLREVK